MKSTDLGELIKEETAKRLDEMESPEYVFPKKATKTDAIIIVSVIVVCIILCALCMTGVIS